MLSLYERRDFLSPNSAVTRPPARNSHPLRPSPFILSFQEIIHRWEMLSSALFRLIVMAGDHIGEDRTGADTGFRVISSKLTSCLPIIIAHSGLRVSGSINRVSLRRTGTIPFAPGTLSACRGSTHWCLLWRLHGLL